MKNKKVKAYELLIGQGFCVSSDEARRWIMAGKVIADDRRVDKAEELVPEGADVRIKGMSKYVGKGGYKLEGALSDFGISVAERTVLDAGASTGGFTDCLLQRGAKRVYSVDAGHGALAGRLRNNDRVVNLERTNISDMTTEDLEPLPSLATVDLSYLSLRKAIPIVAKLLEPGGQIVGLVKPLFEVEDPEVRRLGRIKDPAIYRDVLKNLQQFVRNEQLGLMGISHSHIRGNKGTVEFWMWVSREATAGGMVTVDIEKTVESAMMLPAWNRDAAS
jgi:23S rRNA (cytidine1920-2'-O)/16S rRNA (cytidine1409-2'-O)-methyltransferase